MEFSKVTSKFQATVPADVRAALGIKAGDTVAWEVADGVVSVRRAQRPQVADQSWMALANESFADEWMSPEDEEAFRHLQ
jgi:antitoxin PrlF